MENKLSKDELDDIMNKIDHPFTENVQVYTDENNIQWACNLGDNRNVDEKFEICYEDDDEKLLDGIYKSEIFTEGVVAANFIDEGAPIPSQSYKPFVILKKRLI